MEKINEKGKPHIKQEVERITSIVKSDKLSEKKKSEMRSRLNIALHFDFEIGPSASTLGPGSSEL